MSNVKTIDWAKRDNKRANDAYINLMLSQLTRIKKEITSVVFPAADWLFEKQLCEKFPNNIFKFLAVEQDVDVHDRCLDTLEKMMAVEDKNYQLELLPKHHDFLSIVSRNYTSSIVPHHNGVDLLYPDKMGCWNMEFIQELDILFSGDKPLLNCGGMFITTLQLARAYGDTHSKVAAIGKKQPSTFFNKILDDQWYERLTGYTRSDKVYNFTIGIVSEIIRIAKSHGTHLVFNGVHIYYSKGENKTHNIPEGSFCFTRVPFCSI
jgi:hypothetical protein